MPIDFTLTPEQQRLRADARAFARDVLSKVGAATQALPTPLARFAATRPFYEQTVAAGFLRRLIPAPLGGEGTGVVDMAVLARGVPRRRCQHLADLARHHAGPVPGAAGRHAGTGGARLRPLRGEEGRPARRLRPEANRAAAPTSPLPPRPKAYAPGRVWKAITG